MKVNNKKETWSTKAGKKKIEIQCLKLSRIHILKGQLRLKKWLSTVVYTNGRSFWTMGFLGVLIVFQLIVTHFLSHNKQSFCSHKEKAMLAVAQFLASHSRTHPDGLAGKES